MNLLLENSSYDHQNSFLEQSEKRNSSKVDGTNIISETQFGYKNLIVIYLGLISKIILYLCI